MARKTTSASNETSANNNNGFKAADAFLRLEIVDANGNKHRLPKDVALYLQNHLSAQLIKAAKADADKEFTLVGKVHVIDNSPKEDIAF